jgi:hypothetical protein
MQSDTLLLQSILDRLSILDAKVDHISERQVIIGERVDSHLKADPSENKSGLTTAISVIRQWLFPIVLAIFLLGRQSTEYTSKSSYTYPKAHDKAQLDDTFIASDRRFDSLIMKQIYKSTGVKP